MSANERQVGGAHYMDGYQHWDMAVDFQLGYFPGQITKYITRHRKKNGRQDVEKALHFLDKWEECIQAKMLPEFEQMPRVAQPMRLLNLYASDRGLGLDEEYVMVQCCTVRGLRCVPQVRAAIERILATYPTAQRVGVTTLQDTERKFVEVPYQHVGEDTGDAGPGYVDQDR